MIAAFSLNVTKSVPGRDPLVDGFGLVMLVFLMPIATVLVLAKVAARREQAKGGATGATVITRAHGEGLKPKKTFLGLELPAYRDIILLIVEERLSGNILAAVARGGEFEMRPGSGIAFQLAIEDAVGLGSQISALESRIKEKS